MIIRKRKPLMKIGCFALAVTLFGGCALPATAPQEASTGPYDYELIFPSDKYPETALHILGAIEQGHSAVCTIDREGAEENRRQSLSGIDTRKGYDRDEWPMAMCKEGGEGASIAYVDSSDNRGAGSWVGNKLSDYKDNEKVLFIVEKPKKLFPEPATAAPAASASPETRGAFASCKEAREAGAAPLRKGDPGYSTKLDGDRDGVACE